MEPMEVASAALERNLGWVRAADEKVPPIFAVNAAMLGVLALRLPRLGQLTDFELMLCGVAGVALLLSTIFLGCATFPNLSGPLDSIVFFGTAAAMPEAKYIERLCAPTGLDDLTYDLARQAYRNAEIAERKYMFVKLAMIALFVAAPFWLGALISTRQI